MILTNVPTRDTAISVLVLNADSDSIVDEAGQIHPGMMQLTIERSTKQSWVLHEGITVGHIQLGDRILRVVAPHRLTSRERAKPLDCAD